MEYNEIKRCFKECPELAGIDDAIAASLFWHAEEQTLEEGEIIYWEGVKLDNTFGLLLSGTLAVERAGEMVGTVAEQHVFGEMAYFSQHRARNGTIRVVSAQAVILKFELSPADLGSVAFSSLRRCLARQTVNRFRDAAQKLAA
jgi:hypothetical protein